MRMKMLYTRGYWKWILLFFLVAGGGAPLSALGCFATASPPVVRAEGIAEIVGDIVLTCSASPTSDAIVTLSVSLNVNITNNSDFGAGSDITDAIVVVNEKNCTSPSASGASFACASGDPRFQDPQYGQLTASNRLEWTSLVFPAPGADDGVGGLNPPTTTIRITGIRANVSQLGVPGPGTFPSTQVTSFISITGPTTIPVTNNVLNVGVPLLGAEADLSSMVNDEFGIVVAENFPSVFLPQGAPTFLPATRLSESGYFAPGSNNGGGASSGARLFAQFFNVPAGTEISVPRQIQYGSAALQGDAIHLSLAPDADASGAGGAPTALTGRHNVSFINGFGVVHYEVMDANPASTESVVIPAVFEAGGPGASFSVSAGLGPRSTVTVASAAQPEPRFLDNSGDPRLLVASPSATTLVSARLTAIPTDDTGKFIVAIDGAPVLDGPVGAFGSADVARGATVAIEVSASPGTTIFNYSTKITCAGGGLTHPVTAEFADTLSAPRSLLLTAPSAGGLPVECTVLNRNTTGTPATTTLEAVLAVLPAADPGAFQALVQGTPAASGGDGSSGSVSVVQGETVIVRQTALAGTTLTDYGTTIVCSGGGLSGIVAGSFLPGDPQARSVAFDVPPGDGTPIRCDFRNQESSLPPPVAPNLLTTCTATAVPPVVRAEGIAEHVGDIVLTCTNSSGETPNAANLVGALSVALNVDVTNNIDFGEGALITDAILVINENNCTTPSAAGSSFGCGPDARFQDPQYGKLVGEDRLEWQNVTFPVPSGLPGDGSVHPAVTTVRITNIRARAEQLGVPNTVSFPSVQITGFIGISGTTIPVTNNVLNVAVPILGLIAVLDPGVGNDMDLTLDEGFATSFKTHGSPAFTSGSSSANWEAGYFTPGSNGGSGAVSGTRFLIRFFGLDPGASVSVPRQLDNGSPATTEDGLQLALVTGYDGDGDGGMATSLTGMESVPLTGGAGLAVYEILDSQPFLLDQITVPILFDSGGIGSGLIHATLAPVSAETEASAAAPEPRFKETPVSAGPPLGPAITNPTVSIAQTAPGLPVVVTANIVDADPGVAFAFLSVKRLNRSWGLPVQMTPMGGSLYSAEVDTRGFQPGTYQVSITAVDSDTPQFQNSVLDAVEFRLACSYFFTPSSAVFGSDGGSGSVDVVAPGNCGWFLTSSAWITPSVVHSGLFTYEVAPNPSDAPRNGEVVINDGFGDPLLNGRHLVAQAGAPPARPDSAGTYSSGLWLLDANGDGAFDAGADRSLALGFPGAQHFVGDWNGDGRDDAGVYKDGFWFLDYDGNDQWDGGVNDKLFPFGWIGATPVVGDWNGDGKTDVGVYNNGFWFLDYDGNQLWDGGVSDRQFGFGWAGVEIQVGDWNGDGRDKVGIFKDGFWFLDYDGDYQWDGGVTDRVFGFGWAGVTPVIGDWNGDGRDKAGVWVNGFWFLDYDGDNLWDGGTTDRLFGWGASTATPVVGDWDNDGSDSAGAVLSGEWVLDVDGDALWDGGTVDRLFNFGAGEPVVGRW